MATLALRSPRPASIDALRSGQASLAVQAAGVVGFALLAALGAQFEIRLYLWEVPITLQTLAVYGSGLFLGGRNGFLAMTLYLALGLVLPVYAGGASGAEHLAGATGGYLLGWPLAAATIGALSARWNTWLGSALAVLAGSAVLFTCGVTVLHYAADHATWWESLDRGWLRFVVWDLTKIAFVGAVYSGARRLTS
ncbi:MAG TPA: biotin transporter BioY [Rubricoccaceae bacterium]|nr:biotin transporter BioY [Rubricoccaceae bacterium]